MAYLAQLARQEMQGVNSDGTVDYNQSGSSSANVAPPRRYTSADMVRVLCVFMQVYITANKNKTSSSYTAYAISGYATCK